MVQELAALPMWQTGGLNLTKIVTVGCLAALVGAVKMA